MKQEETNPEIERNLIFIGTIYDTFEALEETLGKMKMEKPLFLTYIAKREFANEIFNHVKENNQIYLKDDAVREESSHSVQ